MDSLFYFLFRMSVSEEKSEEAFVVNPFVWKHIVEVVAECGIPVTPDSDNKFVLYYKETDKEIPVITHALAQKVSLLNLQMACTMVNQFDFNRMNGYGWAFKVYSWALSDAPKECLIHLQRHLKLWVDEKIAISSSKIRPPTKEAVSRKEPVSQSV